MCIRDRAGGLQVVVSAVQGGQVGFGRGPSCVVGFPLLAVVQVAASGGDLASWSAAGPVTDLDLFGHTGWDLVAGGRDLDGPTGQRVGDHPFPDRPGRPRELLGLLPADGTPARDLADTAVEADDRR